MIKLFRRIRQNLLNVGNLKKYLLYAIGEILLVVIGILVAIQVNNLNNRHMEDEAEKQFYQNFKRQILEDEQVLNGTIAYNNDYRNQYQYAIQIIEDDDRSKMDTLGYITINLTNYSDFDRASNIYESIVTSGEIKLIGNKEIIRRIQVLEETYTYFNRMEEIHYDLVMSIAPNLIANVKYSTRKIQQPQVIYDYKFQNVFIASVGIMNEKDDVYQRAKNQINELIELIDAELGSDR